MPHDGEFEQVYRESFLVRLLEYAFLPMEMGIALTGAVLFVGVPVSFFAGALQQAGWVESLGTMAIGAAFAWWGGSTSAALWVNLIRGAKVFELKVDDVQVTKERSAKGGTHDVWVLHGAGCSFRVSVPPAELRSAVHRGQTVRVLEWPGTKTVREVWVRH